MIAADRISPPYKGTLYLPGDLYERAASYATKHRTTLKALIEEALEHFLRSPDIQIPPDTVPPGTAIVSPHYGNPAEVARRAARVVELLEEAKTLVEQAAEADSGRQSGGPKHTPRKRAGGSQ